MSEYSAGTSFNATTSPRSSPETKVDLLDAYVLAGTSAHRPLIPDIPATATLRVGPPGQDVWTQWSMRSSTSSVEGTAWARKR